MSSIVRIAAAALLLGMFAGCAAWTPNVQTDSMQDPEIYTGVSD
ncbi:MAG TPA: hypothetical protein VHP37_30090 [Burkholderiales bacterium]|jgi:hypothetical protein|nr:hypothetical protein [Burkholderiales bacterium]